MNFDIWPHIKFWPKNLDDENSHTNWPNNDRNFTECIDWLHHQFVIKYEMWIFKIYLSISAVQFPAVHQTTINFIDVYFYKT